MQRENLQELNFNGQWRSYQKRVLEELECHLNDKKLNVVAAPGAGKTTLGIEVLKRLDKPALILAPTITIKEQWAQRIEEYFLQKDADTSFISTSIKNVRKITIITYQALHSLSRKKEEYAIFLESLKNNKIATLLLDESHHLRTEWYKVLCDLTKYLDSKNFTSVALTGTPPYDVPLNEWNNYHNLCGPVDAEISIPELVKNKNLCPHQDLIYFSDLDDSEQIQIFDFEKNRDEFFNYLKTSADFIASIKTSDFCVDFANNEELLYLDTQFTLALLSYLLYEDEMSKEAYYIAEFLGIEVDNAPKFSYVVAEVLFNGVLGQFAKHFGGNILNVKAKLKELKLLENTRNVNFTGKELFKNVYSRSVSKIDSINKITKLEYSILKENLREVVLLDYIGKGDSLGLNIYSVFSNLENIDIDLGILTGTLIVIPKKAKAALYEILSRKSVDVNNVLTTDFNDKYLRVEIYGNVNIVNEVTELFNQGYIKVLIGTQALLGEGWDAPCVNTLIIASTIGSFMSSNQMRGRALRVDKENPDKTSDIWHLVTFSQYDSNADLDTITRRFNTFEGVSYFDNKIQNGIGRLGLGELSDIKNLNQIMFERAKNRNSLNTKWNQVFEKSVITEENKIHQVYDIVEVQNSSVPVVVCKSAQSKLKNFFNQKIKNRYIQIIREEHLVLACALQNTLKTFGYINSFDSKISLTIDESNYSVSVTLMDCTNYERNVFVKAYNEIFTPSEKYRYIMKKTSDYSWAIQKQKKFFKIFNFVFSFSKQKYTLPESIFKANSYYLVPEILGTKKQQAESFVNCLGLNFGYFDLIYTRKYEGRAELLKALYSNNYSSFTKRSRLWI